MNGSEKRRAKSLKRIAAVSFSLFALRFSLPLEAARTEIREGRFYVDNEPFYVRGIGYAPWRPHQHPGVSYTNTNRGWTKLDFLLLSSLFSFTGADDNDAGKSNSSKTTKKRGSMLRIYQNCCCEEVINSSMSNEKGRRLRRPNQPEPRF